MWKFVFFLFSSLLVFACDETIAPEKWSQRKNDMDYSSSKKVAAKKFEVPVLMNLREWYVDGNKLICWNDQGNPCYYVLDINDFHLIDSFGIKGKGKNEWILPHLLVKGSDDYSVIDNSRRALYGIKGTDHKIDRLGDFSIPELINYARYIEYPYFAYIVYTPNVIYWKIRNVETTDEISSVPFRDANNKGNAILYDFMYDVFNGKVVFACNKLDRFMVSSLTEDNDVVHGVMVSGEKMESMGRKRFYMDVVCDDTYIYLLSNRFVSVKGEGSSVIEIFDYDGNPVGLVDIGVLANKLTIDRKGKRLLMFSPIDNCIYVVGMSSL